MKPPLKERNAQLEKELDSKNRELKIETALEKVRSRTMAMQKSEELGETSFLLFQQFKKLGETSEQISIGIFNEEKNIMELYSTLHGSQWKEAANIDLKEPVVMKKIHTAWKKKKKSLVIDLTGSELKKYNKYRNSLSGLDYKEKRWVIRVAFFSKGVLTFSTTEQHTTEVLHLLERFAVVFDGTYTRFLDLQKAEAQVRQAEIELALERVRARTMAMHKGNELADTALVLFEQITQLGIKPRSCGFLIMDEASETMEDWSANLDEKEKASIITGTLAFNQHPLISSVVATWRKGAPYFIGEIHGNDLQEYYEAVTSRESTSKFIKEKVLPEAKSEFTNSFYFEYGMMYVLTPKAISDSEISVMLRFAKVFKQTYTRFLDLQKAEAQARESQIQLALERVRARTMAMQRSDELAETVSIVLKQLIGLGIKPAQMRTCAIVTLKPDEPIGECWITKPDGEMISQSFMVPYHEGSAYKPIYDAWKNGEKFFVVHLSGEALIEHLNRLKKYAKIPTQHFQSLPDEPTETYTHALFFSQGYLLIISNESLTEYHDIFKRFGTVFQQTYTRFLDLQKAEAQSREAQIELSLERVRAKTMAMHNSLDVGNTIVTMFDELVKLDVKTDRCGILIGDESQYMEVWTAKSNPNGEATLIIGKLDMMMHPMLQGMNSAWKNKESVYTYEMIGEDLKNYYRAINNANYYPIQFDIASLPLKQIHTDFFFPDGALFAFTPELLSADAKKIFNRFAAVFALTYRRYLDLQKAEAQAREGQIQLALERVRARTMAMQKSDELLEASDTLFDELHKLKVETIRVGIGTIDLSKKEVEIWSRFQKNKHIEDKVRGVVPANVSRVFDNIIKAKKEKKPYTLLTLLDDDVKKHYQSLSKYLSYLSQTKYNKQESFYSFFFTEGALNLVSHQLLSDDECKIMLRFAKVFGQMYTRFLDLQKAEAQAREAQIEAALERVRSRSMGMQKSDELKEVIKVVYEQFVHLNINVEHTGFIMDYKTRDDMHIWLADQHLVPSEVFIPYFDSAHWNSFNEAKEKGTDFFATLLDFEEKNKFYKDLFALIPGVPEESLEYYFSCPGLAGSTVLLDNISLYIENFQGIPYTDDENRILMRFGKVFQQTYTRFLDLQKAEGQAREAEIEAALERVRSKAMAMHKSEDLNIAVSTVFEELEKLKLNILRCGIGIIDKEKRTGHVWTTVKLEEKTVIQVSGQEPMDSHPLLKGTLEAWLKQTDFSYVLEAKDLVDYYTAVAKTDFSLPESHSILQETTGLKQYYYTPTFRSGNLYAFRETPFSEDAKKIIKRFASVLNLTFNRFLDLQKAEAQAGEARIEMALEKVRAESMSMSKSEDLALVVSKVFNELEKLDVKALRCGIGIINGVNRIVKTWVTTSTNVGSNMDISGDEPLSGHPLLDNIFTKWKEQKSFSYILEGNDLVDYYKLVGNTDFQRKFAKEILSNSSARHFYHCVMFPAGGLFTFSETPFTEDTCRVLKRFADAFYHAYKRFEDLQKAEAQAREAQIEASLERVRSRSLAMHHSDELGEMVTVVFKRLQELNILSYSDGISIYTFSETSKDLNLWITGDLSSASRFRIPYTDHPIISDFWNARENGKDFFAKPYNLDEKNSFYKWAFEYSDFKYIPDDLKKLLLEGEGFAVSYALSKNSALSVNNTTGKLLTENSNEILKRFAKVFEQAYIRFLDLQKAEAQAREALIEMALEKVRSRTMAMHKSDELAETAAILTKQLNLLGIEPISLYIGIFKPNNGDIEIWSTDENGNEINSRYVVNINKNSSIKKIYDSWTTKERFIAMDMQGKELEDWIGYWREEHHLFFKPGSFFYRRIQNIVYFSKGFIAFTSHDEQPVETFQLLERFTIVFNLTYTRFLDLQKAEVQAREAQIETALEKVRSRSLAMHKSDELKDLVLVVFEKLKELNIAVEGGVTISIYTEGSRDQVQWVAAPDLISSTRFSLPYAKDTIISDHIYAKESGVDFFEKTYSFEEKNKMLNYLFKDTDFKYLPEEIKNYILQSESYSQSIAFSKNSSIFINSYSGVLLSAKEADILKRFAKVFEQAYIRFLDLEKAEAQAREATIEAALERVRGKAMAMHTSRDLAETINVFYHEMELLSITPRRCGLGLIDKETHIVELSTMNTAEEGNSIEVIGKLKLFDHPVLEGIYDNWLLQKEYHPVMRGNEIKEYNQHVRPQISYPDHPNDAVQYGYFFFFQEGGVYAWTNKELEEDELKIYRRFTTVLSLTYKRYKDLTDAEARAKEAIKQASLDRVRGEIASMRSTEDLQRITPLIFKELTALGVPFFRCGVFIINESENIVHAYLSAPDGHSLAVLNLLFDSNELTANSVQFWRKGMVYHQHWNKEEFIEWTQSMIKQGQIQKRETYQGAAAPPEALDLHFVPFTQGMLYVGNSIRLNEEEIALVKSLAEAFSIAYARYEDFTKLEHAKQSIENTLTELKATQKQLVQSEKMASLGELTAGIAHEIQNPLNFVNNFSDVNKELLGEMKDEIDKGNTEEAKSIANDIIANEEKINHHGKRAGDIVKGMLQHSRSSTGVKEPTDINALADEYLRLSYHGLRAKDKSFNAKMKTDFDESIGKINIIPQDIGRVLLNLFNNAFYAVNEQKNKNLISYEPTVLLTTKKSGNSVIITVSDNGNGIPKKIVDKIFQPFFTTKPTGQGTGLGLSLSYDIVKAHGGEIRVEKREDEGSPDELFGRGTEFIIVLPVS